jgi:hypothetical protein
MSGLTLVKVRGKRKATESEKWHFGKKRKSAYEPSEPTTSDSDSADAYRKRRRRREPRLTPLEKLPAELVQVIFQLSENADLPLASRQLHYQLTGTHVQYEITTRVLDHILLGTKSNTKQITEECKAASRLMNCRFFTYSFFQAWLLREFVRRELLPVLEEYLAKPSRNVTMQRKLFRRSNPPPKCRIPRGSMSLTHKSTKHESKDPERRARWTWEYLAPDPHLLPPKKLLFSPFSRDKVRFLRLMAGCAQKHWIKNYRGFNGLMQQPIKHAIDEKADDVLKIFSELGIRAETATVRYAIVNAGCDYKIVNDLVYDNLDRGLFNAARNDGQPRVDFLDTEMWAWAEEAQHQGDPKGAWLKGLLREAGRPLDTQIRYNYPVPPTEAQRRMYNLPPEVTRDQLGKSPDLKISS